MKDIMIGVRPKLKSSCLSLCLLSVIACAPQIAQNPIQTQPQATQSPGTIAASAAPAPQNPAAQTESFQDFITQSVALQASYRNNQDSPSTPLPIKDYPLPRGLKLAEIQIEKVLLDGKIIPSDNLQLSLDPQGNLVFLLKAAQSLISEVSDLPDITQSPVFQQRQTALQERLLQQPAPEAPKSVPKPSFLQARVRGEQLTRQQMGTLSAGAGELAKSGVYLDRQFSVILSVRNQSFVVAQKAARTLLMNFELRGDMLQQWLSQPDSKASEIKVLPLIASSDQKDLLSEVADIDAGLARIEKNLHEHLLSILLGPETVALNQNEPQSFRDFKVILAEDVWQDVQDQTPGSSLTSARVAPSLMQLLSLSASQAQSLQALFKTYGRTPISDTQLYNAQAESITPLEIRSLLSEQLQSESSSCAGSFATQSVACK